MESSLSQVSMSPSDGTTSEDVLVPQKWRHLRGLLEANGWKEDRISGSHYIFVKKGHRCIPLAFHGASVSKRYAKLVLHQAQTLPANEESADASVLEAFDEEESSEDFTTKGRRSQPKDTRHGPESCALPVPHFHTKVTELDKLHMNTQIETQKKKSNEEQMRQLALLDAIQGAIAAGDFARALSLIEKEHLDLVGSSDTQFRFASDLIFFKLVALTERAFDEYVFNSKQQQESILEVLRQASRFMEAVCDRRNEVRLLGMSLQGRVIQLYLDGAGVAFEKYANAILWKELLATWPGPGLVPEEAKISATQEFVYTQLDTILTCLHFIVSMHQLVKSQPFRPERAMQLIEEVFIVECITPCIRRMLILFDLEEFVASEEAANTLLYAIEQFGSGLQLANAISFPVPPCARMTSELVVGIAKNIRDLSPVYQFAKTALTWSRYAGVIARYLETDNDSELTSKFQKCTCDFGSALKFADEVIGATAKTHAYAQDLVISNMTRTFVFDTLIDPIELLHFAVRDLCSNRKHFVGSLVLDCLTGFANSGCEDIFHWATTAAPKNKLKEFRKSNYDELRREIIRAFDRLQKLANIYDGYCDYLDEDGRAKIETNTGITRSLYRFERINSARYDLVTLFNLFFDAASIASLVFCKTVAVLLADLDVARMFHMDLSTKLRGQCQSSTEVLGVGRWSFNLVFQCLMPRFLERYVFEEDKIKRLNVINDLGSGAEIGRLGLDSLEFVECTAFALLSELLELQRPIAEAFVRDFLNTLAHDTTKSAVYRRLTKKKGKKFTKKIEQLVRSARDQKELLRSCLEARRAAVASLMAKLETSVMQSRGLPEDVKDRIESPTISWRDKIVLTTQNSVHVHPWSNQDANEISSAVTTLQDAAEAATVFLHHATSQKYPIVKSISNPSWTQQECLKSSESLSDDARFVLFEMVCLHDIIRRANA
jgi:predicted RNA binding protein YcfA (HicA-like mRNA interferase family)